MIAENFVRWYASNWTHATDARIKLKLSEMEQSERLRLHLMFHKVYNLRNIGEE